MFKLFKSANPEEVTVTFSTRTLVRVLVFAGLSVVAFAAIKRAEHALILIFTAFFLSLALNAPVQWTARHLPGRMRGKRSAGTTIAFLLVVIIIAVFMASIVPPLVRQTNNFITAVPHLLRDLHSQNSDLGRLVRRYNLEGPINELSSQLSNRIKNSGSTAVAATTRIGSSIFAMLTILALTFMMLIEGPHWLRFGRELLPPARRRIADRLGVDMYRVIKGYVNGQVILAALAAVLILPALFVLHISYPIGLMVIIFVCGLIPMVGHTIGAAIVTTVALFHSPVAAMIILAYYILYQQIENYVVQPRIQANSTDMSPLLVFTSVVVGVNFGGLFGGLVAIPVAGCLRILLLDYLKTHDVLPGQPDVAQEEAAAR